MKPTERIPPNYAELPARVLPNGWVELGASHISGIIRLPEAMKGKRK